MFVSRSRRAVLALAATLVTVLATLSTALAAPPARAQAGTPGLVRDWPRAGTPNVADGAVQAIARIGDTVLAGGTFTQVADAGSDTELSRPYLFAFDAATGAVSTTFRPALSGEVDAIAPGPPGTVYVGGQFRTVDGVSQKGVALLDLADGSLVRSFDPPYLNGIVTELSVQGGRLLLGGTFHTVGGLARSGLASLDAGTGALDDYLSVQLAGHHNFGTGAVGTKAWAITPDGGTMIVIGNFRTADGVAHDQIVRITLGAGSASVDPTFATSAFGATCNSSAFDSWVRDVAMAPDGSYFVVVGTGGPGGTALCDSASRWETDAVGADVAPTWVDHSGGDTFLSTTVTGTAVYVGGHFRWLNNTPGHDSAGAGAVGRASIAALDPVSGLPYAWNPGRNPRGFGISAMTVTADCLWLGYDTDYLGNFQYRRKRIGCLPMRGGTDPVGTAVPTLPGTVYLAGVGGADTLAARGYDGDTGVGATSTTATGGGWQHLRGGFVVGGYLYTLADDGTLARRAFTGGTPGSPQALDPYHDPYWDSVSTGSGQTYRGSPSSFFTELGAVTSITYRAGRLFYTMAGSTALYWRWFAPDSGTVGADRHQLTGTFAGVRGMFTAGSEWYTVDATGTLTRYPIVGGVPAPAGVQVSGPLLDGHDWRAAALFVGP
ncbi:hypothetical protein Athai_10860 [Actinocatenispora thailandica]|uniref:Delta-60 repeat domain-containing protein n=1 Tax=Actinocatenispora thailandica TaxID=227318 RepID=A0A7R7DL29_9ACTN|nr:hypothetical protein [Actinocatenispora thailandica]BCJ33583.1 hypothetical protein Athai_10860 [Actinocatenispora thailandica]